MLHLFCETFYNDAYYGCVFQSRNYRKHIFTTNFRICQNIISALAFPICFY